MGFGRAADRRAFDEPFMETKFAVVADRDDAAGAGAVLVAVDREAVDRLVDFAAAFLELRRFGRELVAPILLADLFEFAEALLDALDLGGKFGRELGRLRTHARVLRHEAVFGIERRPGPGPVRAQFGGLGFELLDREAFHQRGIVEEAVFVAAEEIARDPAAGGLVGRGADEQAEIGIERHGALGQEALHAVGLDVGMVLELLPHGELRRVIGAEREGGHDLEPDRRRRGMRRAIRARACRDAGAAGHAVRQRRSGWRSASIVSPASISAAMATNSSAGCIAARMVFSISEVSSASSGCLDQARHLEIGRDHAFGGELLQEP